MSFSWSFSRNLRTRRARASSGASSCAAYIHKAATQATTCSSSMRWSSFLLRFRRFLARRSAEPTTAPRAAPRPINAGKRWRMPSALITRRGAPVASSIASSRGCSKAAASTRNAGAAAARPSLRHRNISSTPSAFTNSGVASAAPLNKAAKLWNRFSNNSSSSGDSGSFRRYLAQALSNASMVAGVAKVEAQEPQSMDRTSALYNLTASSPVLATMRVESHFWRTVAAFLATSSSSKICSKTPSAWCRACASSGTPSSKRSSDCAKSKYRKCCSIPLPTPALCFDAYAFRWLRWGDDLADKKNLREQMITTFTNIALVAALFLMIAMEFILESGDLREHGRRVYAIYIFIWMASFTFFSFCTFVF